MTLTYETKIHSGAGGCEKAERAPDQQPKNNFEKICTRDLGSRKMEPSGLLEFAVIIVTLPISG